MESCGCSRALERCQRHFHRIGRHVRGIRVVEWKRAIRPVDVIRWRDHAVRRRDRGVRWRIVIFHGVVYGNRWRRYHGLRVARGFLDLRVTTWSHGFVLRRRRQRQRRRRRGPISWFTSLSFHAYTLAWPVATCTTGQQQLGLRACRQIYEQFEWYTLCLRLRVWFCWDFTGNKLSSTSRRRSAGANSSENVSYAFTASSVKRPRELSLFYKRDTSKHRASECAGKGRRLRHDVGSTLIALRWKPVKWILNVDSC